MIIKSKVNIYLMQIMEKSEAVLHKTFIFLRWKINK